MPFHEIQKLLGKDNIIPSEINALIILFYPMLIWMISHHQFIEVQSEAIPTIIQGKFRHSNCCYIDKGINCGNIIMILFFMQRIRKS